MIEFLTFAGGVVIMLIIMELFTNWLVYGGKIDHELAEQVIEKLRNYPANGINFKHQIFHSLYVDKDGDFIQPLGDMIYVTTTSNLLPWMPKMWHMRNHGQFSFKQSQEITKIFNEKHSEFIGTSK